MSYGTDYGAGETNIDKEIGIRYGVIPQNAVLQLWADSSEPDYGAPTCPKCGNEAIPIDNVPFDLDDCKVIRKEGIYTKYVLRIPEGYREECLGLKEWHDNGRDYACLSCARSFDSDEAFCDEQLSFSLDDGEYLAESDSYGDIFILKSTYYTHAQFCSPCAPGACHLENPTDEGGSRAYCFAPDWFDCFSEESPAGEYEGQETSCPYPVYRVSDGECIYRPYGDDELPRKPR